MLILGIDTSGAQGSVALLRATPSAAPSPRDELVTLETVSLAGGRCSELLVPSIAAILESQGAKRSSLELIAVASGPGSFTGLRVAVATAKGLAEAFATPVVAISVLEALALAAPCEGDITAVLDARRSELFFGDYFLDGSATEPAQMVRESITSLSAFLVSESARQRAVITCDEPLVSPMREAGISVHFIARPDAEAYARIAYRKFCAGERADVATLDANYLRRSDAELFSAPKLGIAPA